MEKFQHFGEKRQRFGPKSWKQAEHVFLVLFSVLGLLFAGFCMGQPLRLGATPLI